MNPILNKAADILDAASPKEISFLTVADPFRFLISVILSAQTTDERVNMVTPVLFGKYPDAKALSEANVDGVREIIRSIGFYNAKARNIIGTAKAIVENHDGKVPSDMDELLELPGVGRKTAHCLRSNILGIPGIVVDTHFSRVVNRLFGLGTRDPQAIEDYVSDNLDIGKWSRFSMTANLHGRILCHPSKPECGKCPLKGICEFYANSSC